ncbi:DUF4142 domain-containing protein [Xanthomonas maliensis]|uniref:DUF4142 domain-containing protein n=1 Tax=Xanthomonas maliensis TaxID=1321368 RepID=UPI0003A968EB|nr:DUF4142 domain-containing protein [Xanthomonas maliensis]KAB7771820.1 DUF4142 domain-containing protein [Xanthomonas maliensis]
MIRFRHLMIASTLCMGGMAAATAAAGQQSTSDVAKAGVDGATNATSKEERAALGVLSAINTSEINAANLMLQSQPSSAVRDYAARMVKEHTANNQAVARWSPDTSAADARAQMAKGKAELQALQQAQGTQREMAYVKAMVKDHGEALQTLDQKLIPAAKTPQVAQHLTTTRHHVADHLAAAEALQQAAGRSGAR